MVLDPYQLQDILKWVDSYILSRPSKKLSRDFSDAVLLAEILKCEFPKLVDLHNYVSCCSVQSKIKNWDILNQKVLRKLQINLKRDEMEKLSKAENNCIEQLLLTVMRKVKLIRETEQKELERKENLTEFVTITKKIGDHIEVQHVIPYTSYEELQQEYESLKSYTSDLEEEIKELRNALESKTQIIHDLDARLEESRKKGSSTINSLRKSLASLF